MLNVALGAVAKPAALYVSLVDSDSFTGFSTSDTMSSHTGWIEFTDYAEATRPQITFGAASAGTITNQVSADFTPSSAEEIVGAFLTTGSAKGGTTGVLIACGSLDQGTRSILAGVIEQFTGTVSATNINS